MEDNRNFDKENNNTNNNSNKKQKQQTKDVNNDQYRQSKSGPPPPYQAAIQSNDIKKQTNERRNELYPQQPAGRPATLLIVPKFYEDKQNNNNLENQSNSIKETTHTKQDYGCLYASDARQYNLKRDIDNNNGKEKEKQRIINQSIDTLNTAYTYHDTCCTSESMVTIGGVTLNQGSHSFDLESNFSRMVLGSHGTNSTLSAFNGKKPKKIDLLNFAHFLQTPRLDGLQQPIRPSHNIWFEAKQAQKPTVATVKQVLIKATAEKKEKKKRLGPPPQARSQASRQMDDPLANRPRTHISEKSKKEKKTEFQLQTAAANEKY